MSADNWAVCPKCGNKAVTEWEEKEKTVGGSYGNVSAEEYLAAVRDLGERPAAPETLREDYEIGIDDGAFSVDYRAACADCGFTYTFQHSSVVKR